jgi:hypothetical protein
VTKIGNRNIALSVEKETTGAKFWPRLQKSAGKLSFVKTDFSKYVDEDEDDEAPFNPYANPQASLNEEMMKMMGGMGGMPGMNPDLLKKLGEQEQVNN